MSLIYSAITPHSSLLIPGVGKKNTELLKKTSDSLKRIEEDLYAAQIETLIIISSHSSSADETFALNLAPEFQINFEEFGDFTSKKTLPGDILLTQEIKQNLSREYKAGLINKTVLNHGSGVPLYLLTENLKNIKIIPIYCAQTDLPTHLSVGENLQKTLVESNQRIAVIASGDLSHTLTPNAPGGYSPKAPGFDQKVIEQLQNKKIPELTKTNPELLEEVQTEGLKAISLLMGVLNKMNYTPKLLSYEHPFGVGYLAMSFYL